jgi:deoxyinosine 3'endonuclease (endonuclease V)
VLASDAAFAHVLAERTAMTARVPAYRPGEFYLRELPPLRAVLSVVSGLSLLVVDGYADLDPSGRPGLGAHAHAEFGIPVIGVAKSPVPHGHPRGPGQPRILGTPAVRHRGRDARSRRGRPGPAHDRPVPAARRTTPRRPSRASRSAHSHHNRPAGTADLCIRAERGRRVGIYATVICNER